MKLSLEGGGIICVQSFLVSCELFEQRLAEIEALDLWRAWYFDLLVNCLLALLDQ